MFLNTLFHPTEVHETPDSITALGRLDAAHPVFAAHFPEQPVLPGVVMLQLAEEIFRTARCCPSRPCLSTVKNAKFLSPVTPPQQTELRFTLTAGPLVDDRLAVKAVIESGTTRCATFSLVFTVAENE